ncbi:MAG: hypothetical protein ACPGVT_05385 [Maricaulaceae bacterium]
MVDFTKLDDTDHQILKTGLYFYKAQLNTQMSEAEARQDSRDYNQCAVERGRVDRLIRLFGGVTFLASETQNG